MMSEAKPSRFHSLATCHPVSDETSHPVLTVPDPGGSLNYNDSLIAGN